MSALTTAYCSSDALREHISDTNTTVSDAMIDRAVNTASRAIDRYCGRRFWKDDTVQTKTYVANGGDLLWVDDIATTTGLVIKTDTAVNGTWATTWLATDYQLEPLNGGGDGIAYAFWLIRAIGNQSFPSYAGRGLVQVTARFGWSTVPEQVEQACLLKAAALLKRKDTPEGITGMEAGGIRISRFDPDVVSLLGPFKRVGV